MHVKRSRQDKNWQWKNNNDKNKEEKNIAEIIGSFTLAEDQFVSNWSSIRLSPK